MFCRGLSTRWSSARQFLKTDAPRVELRSDLLGSGDTIARMASYYLSFKCDTCGEIAVAPVLGVNLTRHDEIFASNATHDSTCAKGHKSVYFTNQIVAVHRKLSPSERASFPELLNDERFIDIE